MGIFGSSLPPGCSTLPGEEDEQPVQLHEDKTLKGYGRRGHGLNGKDADLDYGGQNIVREAWWFADGTIQINGHRYASIVPNENANDDQMDMATEIVCGEDYGGEWDGDYWVIGEDYSLTGKLEWDDEKTEQENEDAALAYACELIAEDSAKFETAMKYLAKAVEDVTGEL